ncbi:lytic transglycosylase domain-containing protein [Pararhodonellum marinum]|uniref:lytic transglycosylase domain-containing protein n=1 Tax=Pararhodonellum marinum TaxID=2755358 RepID=UPI00188DDD1E|nr:lytic transglycosylase domain-containing protein [Pararhodonellum marinum]
MLRYKIPLLYFLVCGLIAWNLFLTFRAATHQQVIGTVVEDEPGVIQAANWMNNPTGLFEVPNKIDFAGEKVPLDIPDVFERFEREIYVNAYWQSNMILLMKRAGKYLPTIESILAKHGIPDDFKYVAIAESGLMNVSSPAGARGFWQLMEGTAKDYKLEISPDVDERYHLEKSTEAACKFLKWAHAKYGNWTNVAAGYNMGVAGLARRMNEQNLNTYYDLLLYDETSRYVFRVVAIKEIFENPARYGFHLNENDFYKAPLMRELVVDQSISNLSDWAITHNSNYKELKLYNPWLRSSRLTVKGNNQYTIKLPV